jgi:predicted RND superfamily exporter protein
LKQAFVLLLATGALAALALQASPRYRVQDFFPQSTPERADFETVRDSFGRDDRTGILVLTRDAPLDGSAWSELERITETLQACEPCDAIVSPTTAVVVTADPQGAPTLRPAGELSCDAALPALARLGVQLVSDDGRLALIGAVLRPDRLSYADRSALADELLAAVPADATWTAHVAGYPVHRALLTDLVRDESRRLYPLVLAVIALVLLGAFRSPLAVFVTLSVAGLAAVWTTGLMVLFDRPPNILSPGVYVLVAVLGVADAVHLLARRDVRAVWRPCALSTITTAVGFAALAFTDIPMIADFGLQVALGVLSALAITFLLVPPLLPHLPPPRASILSFAALDRFTARFALPLTVVGLVVLALGALAAGRVQVNSPLLADLSPDHPVRQTYTLLEEHLGGVIPLDVIVTGTKPALYQQPTLEAVAAFAEEARLVPGVMRVTSVVDVLTGLEPILRSQVPIAPTGLLPTAFLLAPERVRPFVDYERSLQRIRLRIANLDTVEAFALFAALDALHQKHFDAPIRLTGQGFLAQTINATLVSHFQTGFGVALAAVLLILFVALKRPALTLAALPPNLLPMAVVLIVMATLGIELRYTSALVLTVVFALAVDDTIHFIDAARHGVSHAYTHAGPAILLTSVVLSLGFGVLLTSDFLPNQVMGGLLAVCAVSAAAADLILLPALLRLQKQRH